MKFRKRWAATVALFSITVPSRTEAHDVAEQSIQPASSNSEEAIRVLAFSKWEAADCPEGDRVEFWLEPERELNPGSRQHAGECRGI